MGSELINLMDVVGPTEPSSSDPKTIIIIAVAVVIVLAVSFIVASKIKKNN